MTTDRPKAKRRDPGASPVRPGGQGSSIVRFSNAPEVFSKAEQLYRKVSQELRRILPPAELHHVGSTAIPGTLTKGDLDIALRVKRNVFRKADRLLEKLFARNLMSPRHNAFSAFQDMSTDPPLGIQLVVIGASEDTFHSWKSRLESNAELRRQYDELKRRHDGRSAEAYREDKARFIEAHLGKWSPSHEQ